jgi:4a-hydroxytetrahydrobiopterin dehydratase
MAKLASRHCSPVKKGSNPLSPNIARSLLNQISNTWRFDAQIKSIECEFKFTDYHRTIQFVNAVAWIANTEDHHPNLEIGYDRCKVTFSTHAAEGLTVNDFICAAKIDALFKEPDQVSLAKPDKPIVKTPQNTAAAITTPTTRPAKHKSADSVAKGNELFFDFQEAEELLSENIELASIPDDADAGSYEDEFQLIEPAIEPPAVEAQETTPTIKSATPAKTREAIDMMSTVILPPGMKTIDGKSPYDDEDATVIIPEEMQPDSEPNSEPDPPPSVLVKSEDADEVKTVILGAAASGQLLNPDTKTILPPSHPAPKSAPVKKPQVANPAPPQASVNKANTKPQRTADPDEIGTLILSSNPTNRPKPTPAPMPPQETNSPEKNRHTDPDEVATMQTQEVAEDDADKTIADDNMATMVLNAVDIEAMTAGQKPEKPQAKQPKNPSSQKTGKADPEIEDDDTLVMHVNSYQKVQHDKG